MWNVRRLRGSAKKAYSMNPRAHAAGVVCTFLAFPDVLESRPYRRQSHTKLRNKITKRLAIAVVADVQHYFLWCC